MDYRERSNILHQGLEYATVGDKVYRPSQYQRGKIVVATITKATDTQVTIDQPRHGDPNVGTRLNRKTGVRIGDARSWNSDQWYMYTPAAAALLEAEAKEYETVRQRETKLRELQGRVARLTVSQVTDELLATIAAALPPA